MSLKPIREEVHGDLTLRLIQPSAGRYLGAVIPKTGGRLGPFEGKDADAVWCMLEEEAARAHKSYLGYDGALARFRRYFPRGFADPYFAKMEGNYKQDAKADLDRAAPVQDVAVGTGYGEAALAAYRATNLLSPFEEMRVAEALRGPHADVFLRAAASFALGAGTPALQAMRDVLHPYDAAKWTIVTYLPFLWRPDLHMFLKPEVTREFAARVGHRFHYAYAPALEIETYDALLDLAIRTEEEIRLLRPMDRIDVQSFIWVVGSYGEDELPPR